MIAPDYARTMAAYNAEMNRRVYAAAARSGVRSTARARPEPRRLKGRGKRALGTRAKVGK